VFNTIGKKQERGFTVLKEELETIQWFDDKFYKRLFPNGKIDYYRSSTTVLGIIEKPFLRQWYGDLGTELAQYRSKLAKERGSLIHQGIYDLLQGKGQSGDAWKQEDYYQLWNFTEFWNSLNPTLLGNELQVFSDKHRVAGTLDLLTTINKSNFNLEYLEKQYGKRYLEQFEDFENGIYVGDVKTGNMDWAYHLQTASYAMMAIEQEFIKSEDFKGTYIIQTRADNKLGWKLHIRNKTEAQEDLKGFMSALFLANMKGEEKPKIFEMPNKIKLNL
jgi:hypothetical protein